MGDLADWWSAAAATAAAYAAIQSLTVSRTAAKQAKDARRSATLREWRHTTVSVIVEGGACLGAIRLLVPVVDGVAALSGGFGSAHEQIQTVLKELETSIRSTVDEATELRAQATDMHNASSGDLETALMKAVEHLAGVRVATDQCAKLQLGMEAERVRLLQERAAREASAG